MPIRRSVRIALYVCTVGLFVLWGQARPAWAQQGQAAPAGAEAAAGTRISAAALPIEEAPMIDGILSEQAWQKAPVLSGFTQAEPLEGQPASEATEIRILYDNDAIYVGVTLHDSDPSQIVTTDTRRDADLNDMDSFQIIFDTFRDQQNGFVFGTNAQGVQYDAQVRDQGNASNTWDGSWDVETNVTESGWTAEFRIPLRTLRYGPAPQTWGINAYRNIQRTRERTFWAPLARIYNIGRLSSAGDLRGLELQTPRNLKVLPYVIGSANRNYTRSGIVNDTNGDFGFDAKFGVTPSLNLDATYNTDFAQVEVDNQQINLTRFNLRFPEKRPFFQENSGLFRIGQGQEVDLFFSRRIGLDNNGGLVPIRGGGRLTGKVNGFNVGLLNLQTDDTASTPANNFSVLRASRELRNRSGVGVMFINRSATGDRSANNWNRTWGTDARLGVGEHFTLSGYGARTETPGRLGRDFAYNANMRWDDGRHDGQLEYGETGENFNPEAGFLETPGGYRRYRIGYGEVWRQEPIRNAGFRELNPHFNYTRFDYQDGGLLNAELHVDNHWDWENGQFITVGVNGTWDGLREPFEVYPGIVVPAGDHGGLRTTFRYNSDRRQPIYGRLQWDLGTFLNGRQSSPTVQMILREGGRFTLDTTWNYRSIDLPQGRFHTNLANMRVTYNFTPSVFVQSLVQFNDRTDRWSTNLRFHWLQTAGTGLFVVYNNTEALNGLGPVNRAFIVKYVRQFDILN